MGRVGKHRVDADIALPRVAMLDVGPSDGGGAVARLKSVVPDDRVGDIADGVVGDSAPVIGGIAGLALSSVQAVSRAMVGALAPPGRSAEFYGFFAVAGRTSSFIGPTIYGFVAAEAAIFFESQGEGASFLWFKLLEGGAPFAEQLGQRVAILPVILFLIVGTGLLLGVNEKKAREWVEEPVSD